jgi:hypothetical protein
MTFWKSFVPFVPFCGKLFWWLKLLTIPARFVSYSGRFGYP